MAKFVAFIDNRVLTGICLCALLLLHTHYGYTAPTSHLTVSVEGNTPTLIVTSAEIGITPKIQHVSNARETAATIPTTTTTSAATDLLVTTPQAAAGTVSTGVRYFVEDIDRKEEAKATKLKGKSPKKQMNKKIQYANKERKKSSRERATNAQQTLKSSTAANMMAITAHRITTATNDDVLKTRTATATIETTTTSNGPTSTSQPFEGNGMEAKRAAAVTVQNSKFDLKTIETPANANAENTTDAILSASGTTELPATTRRVSLAPATSITLAAARMTASEGERGIVVATTDVSEGGNANTKGVTANTPVEATENTQEPKEDVVAKKKHENYSTSEHTSWTGEEATVTVMPKFLEQHDTTAAPTTKGTTVNNGIASDTPSAVLVSMKMPNSAMTSTAGTTTKTPTTTTTITTPTTETPTTTTTTTSQPTNVPMITKQIELLPKAIKLMATMTMTTTTPTSIKTTSPHAELITNPFDIVAGSGEAVVTEKQQMAKDESKISGRDVDGNENGGGAMVTSTTPNVPNDAIDGKANGSGNRFTNTKDNLPKITAAKASIPLGANKNESMATTRAPMYVTVQTKSVTETKTTPETSTLISSTTTATQRKTTKTKTTLQPLPVTSAIISTTITTKANVTTSKQKSHEKLETENVGAGVIFIDDDDDDEHEKLVRHEASGELQYDEAAAVAATMIEATENGSREDNADNKGEAKIKLIDLEKHDYKSIAKAKKLKKKQNNKTKHTLTGEREGESEDKDDDDDEATADEVDDGHDGVKITRKKQLIDNYLLAAAELNESNVEIQGDEAKLPAGLGASAKTDYTSKISNISVDTKDLRQDKVIEIIAKAKQTNHVEPSAKQTAQIATAEALSRSTVPPTTPLHTHNNVMAITHNMESVTQQQQRHHAPPTSTSSFTSHSFVSLKPVPNGYLGPIHMEEKHFSVLHANTKQQPEQQQQKQKQQQHAATIESQLRDGRLVEIIAPTALLEAQITTTTTTTMSSPTEALVAESNDNLTTTTTKPCTTSAKPFRGGAFVYASVSATADQQKTPLLSTTVFQVPELLSSTTGWPLNEKSATAGNSDEGAEDVEEEEEEQYRQQKQSRQQLSSQMQDERTESKISDIQIEVYDSTVDSIVASTNFKDSEAHAHPQPAAARAEVKGAAKHFGTTKPPAAVPQERFTQYVVDRADDYEGQQASAAPFQGLASLAAVAGGKPEPAAIEIHINVSESIDNESEDLEFSYRHNPTDYSGSSGTRNAAATASTGGTTSNNVTTTLSLSNDSANKRVSVERGDEILVVEIIDTGENSTESAVSAENINPIFTFHTDPETDVELKDIKYYPPEVKEQPPQMADELFLAADATKREGEVALPKPPLPPPPPPRKPPQTIDRDSDTIFYISNTEVKVGESPPPPPPPHSPAAHATNTNFEQQQQQQMRKTRLENQFFPANYLASTHPNASRMAEQELQQQRQPQPQPQQHRYEEDIILSPLRNTADSLKIFRGDGDGAPPLDVTYVGESVMEVEQSSGIGAGATTTFSHSPSAPSPSSSAQPDVIIQPAVLPEMSIGVPVIGELPPQIELKEIDFMPDEANQPHSGIYYENNMLLEENGNGNSNGNGGNGLDSGGNANENDVDRVVESSIQYGGDLIDESVVVGGGGVDAVEGSYPFGNPAAAAAATHQQPRTHHEADYAHYIAANHQGVNNLRKDELSADVAASGELLVGVAATVTATATLNNLSNDELRELLERSAGNESLPLMLHGPNGTYTVEIERMLRSNMTPPGGLILEEEARGDGLKYDHAMLLIILCGLLLFVVIFSGFCALWMMYIRYQNRDTHNNETNKNGKSNGETGHKDEKSIEVIIVDKAAAAAAAAEAPSISKQLSPPILDNTNNAMQNGTVGSSSSPSSNYDNTNNNIICNASADGTIMAESVEETVLSLTHPSLAMQPIALPSNQNSMPPTSFSIPSHSTTHTNINSNNNKKLQTFEVVNSNSSTNNHSTVQQQQNSQEDFLTRPNGSVTKMTLKNNHLIVETEERHDISRVARETKMHYNTSEKDGVFVVEVARGIDSKSIPGSPTTDEPRPLIYATPEPATGAAITATATLRSEDEKILRNHEEIQIHQPPPNSMQQQRSTSGSSGGGEIITERSLHQIVELDEPIASPHGFRGVEGVNEHDAKVVAVMEERTPRLVRNSNTGLSQSDLSSSSSTDSNKRYTYGNQELYTVEPVSYAASSPNTHLPPTHATSTSNNAAEDDDRRSENGHSLAHSPAAAEGNSNATTSEHIVQAKNLNDDEQTAARPIVDGGGETVDASEKLIEAHELPVDDISEIVMDNNGALTSSTEAALIGKNADKQGVVETEEVEVEKEVRLEGEEDELKDKENGKASSRQIVKAEQDDYVTEVVEVSGQALPATDETEYATDDAKLMTSMVCNGNNNEILEAQEEAKEETQEVAQGEAANECFLSDSEKSSAELHAEDADANGDVPPPLNAFPQPALVCNNYGYDSLISLPDPPSNEEIKQLADFTSGMDNQQLDSLPPPSPPPPPPLISAGAAAAAADMNENTATTTTAQVITTTNNTFTTEDIMTTATQLKLQQILQKQLTDDKAPPTETDTVTAAIESKTTTLTINGHHNYVAAYGNDVDNSKNINGHEMSNGHGHGHEEEDAEGDGDDDRDGISKILNGVGPGGAQQTGSTTTTNSSDGNASSPLTPPESPPLSASSPLHYANSATRAIGSGINGGLCNGLLPVAVNVNGS